jgi:tetratricopeptide (TPR) repeat protein
MNQTTESFLRIEAIFHDALAASEIAREELIRLQCGEDAALIGEVHSLLEACEAEERETASRNSEPRLAAETQAAHRHIGVYEIDRLLGRGGMGAVYLAHRADGQFEQQVAIKLIDLPLATNVFRERFRQERQILAGLQHPYIARLLDGGVTGGGDPYLVMEYVDGVPIHRYCEQQKLSTADRLALFLRVCEAVQFAHQNFVVHRDLKPDNILVAGDGTPRLLDFGTAKLLSPSLAAPGTELTREGYQSYTPRYASPEQVLGNPITTASDTYSLGVLLYLLLTGAQPYELTEMTTAEMLRVVCEQAPRRPSQVAGSSAKLDVDLEAILLKALRKEPRERYLTAEQLASDLRAYLEGLPVAARQGTFRYKAGKFIGRNRLALLGTALLAVTLIAGVAGIVWQAKVATEERRKAEARSADLRQLSNSLLYELDEAIKELPGSTGVQKLLVTRVLEHLDRMAKDAQGDRQTELDMVDAYRQIGQIQGDPYYQNLGDPQGALQILDKALTIAQSLVKANSADSQARHSLALVQKSRSEILFKSNRTPEAVILMQEVVKELDASIAAPQAPDSLILDTAASYGILGDELGEPETESLNDAAGGLAAYRKDRSLIDRALAIDPGSMRAKRAAAIVSMKLGEMELENDPIQALKDLESSLQILDALSTSGQENFIPAHLRHAVLHREAIALNELGEYKKAVDLYREVLQSDQKWQAADPLDWRPYDDLISDLMDEATGYEYAADPDLAVAPEDRRRNLAAAADLYAQALPLVEKVLQHEPSSDDWKETLAEVQVHIGAIRSGLGSPARGAAIAKTGLAALKKLAGKTDSPPATLQETAQSFLLADSNSFKDSQLVISFAERAVQLSHGKTPSMLLTLAQAYRAAGQSDKSRATAREALALLPAVQPGSAEPRIRKLLEIQAQTGL